MIYTVTFNPAIDYVVHTDAMQVGMVNRSRTEEIYYGGKGINVSMVLKELGLESRALGFVAGFTGAAIEKGVQAKGLSSGQKQSRNCSGNWTSCGTGTPLCWLAAFPVRCRRTPTKRFWHI